MSSTPSDGSTSQVIGDPVQPHRPRILFLTQVLPYPLDAGPKVRAYHMLRDLAEHNDVHLVSFVRDDDAPEAIAHLEGLRPRSLAPGHGGKPRLLVKWTLLTALRVP